MFFENFVNTFLQTLKLNFNNFRTFFENHLHIFLEFNTYLVNNQHICKSKINYIENIIKIKDIVI